MPNPLTLPPADLLSDLRCPHSWCVDYKRRLVMSIGQHETRGDLTVEHTCPECGYAEHGPSSVSAARRTSETVRSAAERLRNLRREGVPVPLRIDHDVWPRGEFDAADA